MNLIQYIETKDITMKHVCIHHLHIKYKGEFYTVHHETGYVTLDNLQHIIDEIKRQSTTKGVKKWH